MDSFAKWSAVANVDLLWQVWGGEHIVYHTLSGDTHLLNPVTASVLRILEKESKTITELAGMFVTDGDAPGEIQGVSLELILQQLDQLCLIETSLS